MEELFDNLELRLGWISPRSLTSLTKLNEIFIDKYKEFKHLFIQKLAIVPSEERLKKLMAKKLLEEFEVLYTFGKKSMLEHQELLPIVNEVFKMVENVYSYSPAVGKDIIYLTSVDEEKGQPLVKELAIALGYTPTDTIRLGLIYNLVFFKLWEREVLKFFKFLGHPFTLKVTKTDQPKKSVLLTKSTKLLAKEFALIYYMYFRSRGIEGKKMLGWFPNVVEKLQKYKIGQIETPSEMSRLDRYFEGQKEHAELDRFTIRLFQKIHEIKTVGADSYRKFIYGSLGSQSVFYTPDDDPLEREKLLRGFWDNFISFQIDYDISNMVSQFDLFIKNPTEYLKG